MAVAKTSRTSIFLEKRRRMATNVAKVMRLKGTGINVRRWPAWHMRSFITRGNNPRKSGRGWRGKGGWQVPSAMCRYEALHSWIPENALPLHSGVMRVHHLNLKAFFS